MKTELFNNDWKNILDFAKEDFLEDCPNCANGFTFIDLKQSFKVVIGKKTTSNKKANKDRKPKNLRLQKI